MKEITVKAIVSNIDTVTEFADQYLESVDCPMKTQMQLDVVIDELFSNIANYAYSGEPGDARVQIGCADGKTIIMVFEDSGMPYNPLQKEDPDITLSADEREIGGLGIFMAKKMTDHMEYEYRDGKNVLTIQKKLAV